MPPGTIICHKKMVRRFAYGKGYAADGKYEAVGHGKFTLPADTPPAAKRIGGKYEIDLNGQHFEGEFVTKRHQYKHPPRICM